MVNHIFVLEFHYHKLFETIGERMCEFTYFFAYALQKMQCTIYYSYYIVILNC